MSSHFAKLKEELDSKQQELQDQQQTVESIKKITEELEAKKQALAAKAAELDDRQKDVKKIQMRLEALNAAMPAVDAAMSTDLVTHVVTKAISGDHMSGSEIFQTLLNINGRSRADNLDDFLTAVIDNDEDLNDIVKHALVNRVNAGANAASLMESVAHTVYTVLGNKAGKATTVEPLKENVTVNLPNWNAPFPVEAQATPSNNNAPPAVQSQAAPSNENAPPGGETQSTPGKKNGLRGQAEDFKPHTKSNGAYNSGGWEAFARENGVGNYSSHGSGKDWVVNGGGWGSNSGRGH